MIRKGCLYYMKQYSFYISQNLRLTESNLVYGVFQQIYYSVVFTYAIIIVELYN